MVVTGGSGFLGRVVVEALTDGLVLAPSEIRVLDPKPYPGEERVTQRAVDIRDRAAITEALRGADVVIHCAGAVDWGVLPESLLEAVNVQGTANVVAACQEAGVNALVHVSTLDVVWQGHAVVDGDETLPYCDKPANGYCRTKTEGEKIALAAEGTATASGTLHVAVVRPCAMYGERDPYHIPPLLRLARAGRLVRIGDGSARSQFVYVGNCAHLLVLAAKDLLGPDPAGAGEAFLATDFEPMNFFDGLAPFLEAAGYPMPPPSKGLPRRPMRALGRVMELISASVRPVWSFKPTLTTFAIDFITLDFTFRTDKARRLLGYQPRFSQAEATKRTAEWFAAKEQV